MRKNIKNKIPDASTLNHTNNTDKQNLEKKIKDANKKLPGISGLETKNVLNTKSSKAEKKISDISGKLTTTAFNTTIGEDDNKILDTSINLQKKHLKQT